eukprot:SAG11_NODE_368_length_10082_cov_299.189622_8_plen_108_part_00
MPSRFYALEVETVNQEPPHLLPAPRGPCFRRQRSTWRKQVTNLPGHAQEEAMEEFYVPADWEKRQKLLKSNRFLFKNDLFEGKSVCYNCRKTTGFPWQDWAYARQMQ